LCVADPAQDAALGRGQGIGSTIVNQVVVIARGEGVDLIEINVDEGDVDAQHFYECHGFCRQSRAPRKGPSTTPRS